jgi:fimbrial isopeptide formation D2 family protein
VFTSDNGQNLDATSACGSEVFTVNPNAPTLSTQTQSSTDNVTFADMTGSVVVGTFVRDTATLTGAATPTTGTVAYTLYNGTTCDGNHPTGTVVFTDSENLASNTIPPSASTQLTTAGTYQWQAVYTSGNGQNLGATSPCGSEAFTVTQPNFTILKSDVPGDGNPVTAGSTIPYTVTIKDVGDGPGAAVITDTLPSNLTIQGTPQCTVTGTDTCTVTNTTGSTWTFAVSLASGDTATATFKATVAATATGTVTNTATITTGPCTTSSGCSSTVSNPIPPVTAPAVVTPTTTTTTAPPVTKPAVIAFTGADIAGMAAGGLALLGLGGFLVLLSRRRRRTTGEIA